MVWSLQLTPWVLLPLIAFLVLAREWAFLWPRRREPGSIALLVLAGAVGLWAAVQLLGMSIPDREAKLVFFQAGLVLSALVTVAWVVFCLLVSGRREALASLAALVFYLASGATVVMVFQGGGHELLIRSARVESTEGGYLALAVVPGLWYWMHLAIRVVAVSVGAALVVARLLRLPATRQRAALPGVAAVLVLLPVVGQMATVFPGATADAAVALRPWRDLSAPAFALAVALLGLGILRHRLLDLGPVARTLVMVELRDPLVVLDGRGRIVDLNRAAERTLGLQVYGDVPLALGTLWASARDRADRYARVTLPVLGAEPTEEEPVPRRVFEVTLTPLGRKDRSGGQTALLLRDVTARDRMEQELRDTTRALRSANEELERLANTDPLTGLANRRHFMEVLEGELERSERYDRPISLVLLDLDHFKRVNDTHGHAAGDAVLRATADIMRSVCRDVDLPARLGGEELAILLPETRGEGAHTLAERLRDRLEDRSHEAADGSRFHVTASVGLVTREGRDKGSADGFLQRADAALYEAKEEGRNRVVVAPAGPAPERDQETG